MKLLIDLIKIIVSYSRNLDVQIIQMPPVV